MIHLVVFLITGQGYFTFLYRYAKHNQEGGREEKNKHELGLALSARGGSLWHFSCILWGNASVYSSENSHKAASNADLHSRVGQPGLCRSTGLSSRLSDFCWLVSSLLGSHLLTDLFCRLVSVAPFCCLSPSLDWPLLSTDLWDNSVPPPSGLVGVLACKPFL